MKKSLTFGVLPSLEEFSEAFVRETGPAKTFHCSHAYSFANDERVGNAELTCSELWAELKKAREEWTVGDENGHETQEGYDAGQWCSDVLSVLGFEWI